MKGISMLSHVGDSKEFGYTQNERTRGLNSPQPTLPLVGRSLGSGRLVPVRGVSSLARRLSKKTGWCVRKKELHGSEAIGALAMV